MELCNLNSKYDDVNLISGLEQVEGFGGRLFLYVVFRVGASLAQVR